MKDEQGGFTMTGDQALCLIASLLAERISFHHEAAKRNPDLSQNTREANTKLVAAARALGIETEVRITLLQYNLFLD